MCLFVVVVAVVVVNRSTSITMIQLTNLGLYPISN